MKKALLTTLFLAGTFQCLQAAPLILNFSNSQNGVIEFSGGSFSFPNNPFDFQITSATGGTGDANGSFGSIGGSYAINTGSIVTNGTKQTASVSGTGLLTILDPDANQLKGTVAFQDIYTDGASGGANSGATINLTGITYTGSRSDLLAFINPPQGIVVLSISLIGLQNLSGLTGLGTVTAPFSGQIAAVPEPLFSGLVLVGAIGMLVWLRRRRESDVISAEV